VFEWKNLKAESPLQHQRLIEAHKMLRSQYDEAAILHLLASGNDAALEAIKLELLKPILEHLHCIHNISPNSIRQWIVSKQPGIVPPSAQALQHLAQPLILQRDFTYEKVTTQPLLAENAICRRKWHKVD